MLRTHPLGDLVLLERLLELSHEAEAVAQIRPHICVIFSKPERALVLLDGLKPPLPVVVPVAEHHGGIGGREMRHIGRNFGRDRARRSQGAGRAPISTARTT